MTENATYCWRTGLGGIYLNGKKGTNICLPQGGENKVMIPPNSSLVNQ